jgi:four helix bundle protein
MANGEWRMGDAELRDRGDAVRSYRDLRVWQEAMSLAVDCYKLTRAFPKDELFGMTAQIRRSSASIAANIAEGHGRESTGAFIQFLRVAQGSLKELETHLLLAERVSINVDREPRRGHGALRHTGSQSATPDSLLAEKGGNGLMLISIRHSPLASGRPQ